MVGEKEDKCVKKEEGWEDDAVLAKTDLSIKIEAGNQELRNLLGANPFYPSFWYCQGQSYHYPFSQS